MLVRPAEWRKNKTIWLAWPSDRELWGDDLEAAQEEFVFLIKALTHESVMVLVPNEQEQKKISMMVNTAILPYGDIWLRDTFPIFVRDEKDNIAAVLPQFNGWGEKYLFADDMTLSERVVKLLGVPSYRSSLVFEGGAIECDGLGTLLTTEQCLLNANRNPQKKKADIEKEFARLFGAKKIIWLKEGLKNDHTDGHIDTIARFMAPKTIAIMMPFDKSDPNYQVLQNIKNQLLEETNADGERFSLVEIPSPGEVKNREGKLMPASYVNFIIGDETVVVPLYGSRYDDQALEIIAAHFSLKTVGSKAKAILSGGGAFHCISQEFFR